MNNLIVDRNKENLISLHLDKTLRISNIKSRSCLYILKFPRKLYSIT